MIRFTNVTKSFGPDTPKVLKGISLDVMKGETITLLGPSGCGKTTLLKLTNRLLDPDSGTIEIDGRNIAGEDPILLRRRIGYVFQGIGLFPHLDVESNVSITLRLLGEGRSFRRRRANELLELVGLPADDFGTRFPADLSGGQQQRVGVARALAADPDYLLMDEPFGALDALTRDALQQELNSLREKLHKTILFVTHDIFEALALGDRIAVMNDGTIDQVGTKQEILTAPASSFVKELFEKPRRQLEAFGGA